MKKLLCYALILLIQLTGFPAVSFAQEATPSADTTSPRQESLIGEANIVENIQADSLINVLEKTSGVNSLESAVNSIPSANLQKLVKIQILKKRTFRADEKITIIIENTLSQNVSVKLFDHDGNNVDVKIEEISESSPAIIKINPPDDFSPGRYRLVITDSSGVSSTQDFTWGVLAINTNKSIYLSNENAKIAIAVLDETGLMVCNAKVNLNITDPSGNISSFSTQNNTIKVNPECLVKGFTLNPDYETSFLTSQVGSYTMNLWAETENGIYSITDTFETRDKVTFDVERISATRIYPPESYPVTLSITANEDFEGIITETVPEIFSISPLEGTLYYDSLQSIPGKVIEEGREEALIPEIGLPFNGEQNLTQGFGALEKDPLLKAKYQEFGVIGHDGVDFDLAQGTEVIAVDDGEVVRARENYDYGTTIVIQHSWGKSYYGHLSKMNVKEGDKVSTGDIIGLSGNTGLSLGSHLHFGVKPNRNDEDNGYYGKINPLPFLGLNKEDEQNPVSIIKNDTKSTYKVIAWKVSLKKGDSIKLGYKYLAPPESPQFYLLGPLEFKNTETEPAIFQETRKWQIAADLVQPNGRLYYGDQTNSVLRFQTNTYDFTFNGELSFTHGGSASLIAHTVAKAAPTRDEVLVGSLKVDGQLMVIKGINGYDVGTDYSLAWTNSGTSGAQTCNSATEVDCTRPFDIAYERLSGRAMVVYADTTNQKLYYCYFDGTNWGPVANCTPTNGTNDISLTSNGRPTFVSLKAKGGTNEILMGVSIDVAGTHEVEAYRWNGSAWTDGVLATATTNASALGLEAGQVFDVEWESNSGNGMVVWGSSGGLGATVYKLFSGGSWGADQTGPTSVGSNGTMYTMNLDADPASDRIAYTYTDDLNDSAPGIWKADGSTQGWTMGNEDAAIGNDNPGTQYADIIWQKSGSVAMWFAETGANAVDKEYQTATCNGAGCTFTAINATVPIAGGDDPTFLRLATSPNSNDIMALWSHIDRDLYAQHWNGSAWEAAASASLEVDMSPGTADNTIFNGMSSAFVYIPYSPWARNWKFWQGTDTTDTPTNQLAAENTAPTGFVPETGKFRLRYSVIELSGMAQTDARKKLQYTSGASCTPDTVEGDTDCTWTDVDNAGGAGIWRYVDCNGGSAVCDDNTTLAGTTLSGTPTAGWWTQSKDAAGGTVMDHSALQLRELEYSVEANGAASTTTYYFRIYDVDQDKAVRREQDNDGANDCATATCTYPSLTTAAPSGPTNDQLMRHGKWFSNGAEAPFTF